MAENKEVHHSSQNNKLSDDIHSSAAKSKVAYCHYFSNYGRCSYEERTGLSCKYEHKKNAPVCHDGISCSRIKCMFKHPNSAAMKTSFLDRNIPSTQPTNPIPPWQMVFPWWGQLHPHQQSSVQGQWTGNPWMSNHLK